AYDSVGKSDAIVMGDAVWQPEGGRVGGALRLDGVDDYVNTLFALNPADTVFSVFAWVKGGAPGQVILSQIDGMNWLMLDAKGYLKTRLKINRREKDLTSAVAINNDTWHRVGFTWDGTNRILYVDDHEVARDTQGGLQKSHGDLFIGAGSNLDRSTFWSGMIDDVRIYDRVVTP
ncbi:MAG: LamG domain-containing protein, partial [Planctomycetes bacterium]|nr:LamG domain-containing protein [Planctomycetota bacterium]